MSYFLRIKKIEVFDIKFCVFVFRRFWLLGSMTMLPEPTQYSYIAPTILLFMQQGILLVILIQ